MTELGTHCDNKTQAESIRVRLCSFLAIALLFFVAAILNSPVPGTGEPHYLSKARAFQDPGWCQRDFFLTSSNAHYVFYVLTGPLTTQFSLKTIAFFGRIFQFALLAAGWSMLGGTLNLGPALRIFSATLFVLFSMLGSMSGEWLIGGFESKVPAWGFCLMAIHFWIRHDASPLQSASTAERVRDHRNLRSTRSAVLAGICCGTACSLHPVVGAWIAVCLIVAACCEHLISRRQTGRTSFLQTLRQLTTFGGSATLTALPGFVPAIQMVFDRSLPEKKRELANFYQVFWRLKHHLDPTEFSLMNWIYAMAFTTLICVLIQKLRRNQTPRNRTLHEPEHRPKHRSLRTLLLIIGASALIAFVGVCIGWHFGPAQEIKHWEWRAALLKFYPFRTLDAFLPMTAAWLVAILVQEKLIHEKKQLAKRILLTSLSIALAAAWVFGSSSPPGYSREQYAEWKNACKWIQQNTPPEALVLTPRESFGFKWYSDRAEFVCYKDCPQDAAGILEWNKRLWILHDWTLNSSMDSMYHKSDLVIAREKTNCDYIITRILGPFESQPLWQGKHWRIYSIPKPAE